MFGVHVAAGPRSGHLKVLPSQELDLPALQDAPHVPRAVHHPQHGAAAALGLPPHVGLAVERGVEISRKPCRRVDEAGLEPLGPAADVPCRRARVRPPAAVSSDGLTAYSK
jgi:hypothetical protein